MTALKCPTAMLERLIEIMVRRMFERMFRRRNCRRGRQAALLLSAAVAAAAVFTVFSAGAIAAAVPSAADEEQMDQTPNAMQEEPEVSEAELDTSPHLKPGGGKYRIAYIDYDEYLPASRHLYYILAGLEELGWIDSGSIPFAIEKIEEEELPTREMYAALLKADLGPYLEFAPDAFFYIGYDDPKVIEETLRERAGKDIDMVLTFGTGAGQFVKGLGLPVPMIDFCATDPVASGIIASSTEGSGDPNIWAHVEPLSIFRQMKFYQSILPFQKLGVVVYGDETISGVPDIQYSARELGFELVKYNIAEQRRETKEELDRYYATVGEQIRKISEEGIDAFFLTVDLINDLSRLRALLEPLYEKKIPVYLMDDVATVKNGGMLLISVNDLVNVGRFIADACAKILNGAEAGSLPCVYSSAPGIYLNYDVARRIGFPLKFEFLAACDGIFTEGG